MEENSILKDVCLALNERTLVKGTHMEEKSQGRNAFISA